jgi:hypothetical protein
MSEESQNDFAASLGFVGKLSITELSKHKFEKKKLLAPFHPIQERIEFSSWKDNFLPLITWGTLLVGTLDRETYLGKFRQIISRIKYRHENFSDELYVDHVRLMCKLVNQMLDDLNHLYPTFKPRLKKYRAVNGAADPTKQ